LVDLYLYDKTMPLLPCDKLQEVTSPKPEPVPYVVDGRPVVSLGGLNRPICTLSTTHTHTHTHAYTHAHTRACADGR